MPSAMKDKPKSFAKKTTTSKPARPPVFAKKTTPKPAKRRPMAPARKPMISRFERF